MDHHWIAAGSCSITEAAAVQWSASEAGLYATTAEGEIMLADVFCAACDGGLDSIESECPGPQKPSIHPHRWRVLTTQVLTKDEVKDLALGLGDPLGRAISKTLDLHCVLCGEFDPSRPRCWKRAELMGAELEIDPKVLEQMFGLEAPDGKWWESR